MFNITENKGVHISFASGYTISIQWGPRNYCDNKSYEYAYNKPVAPCRNAEIAIWKTDGGGLLRIAEYDTFIGYLTADEVAEYIAQCAAGTVKTYPKPEY